MGGGIEGEGDDPFLSALVIGKFNNTHEALELRRRLMIGYRPNLTS